MVEETEPAKKETVSPITNVEITLPYNLTPVKVDPEPPTIVIMEAPIVSNVVVPVTKTEGGEKKYVPQIILVEEPEIPTTTEPPTTTSSPEKEPRTYKSITNAPRDDEEKEEIYLNPILNTNFPNFFSRFQQIFGDTQTTFFVKL